MSTKPINRQDFLTFVETLNGQEVRTAAGRSRFGVQVVGNGLVFTPASTGTPRPHTQLYTDRVLEQFNRTHSFITTDYRFTVNASYMLSLIRLYLNTPNERA